MKRNTRLFLALGLLAAVTLVVFLVARHASNPSVIVTLRIAVTPAEQSTLVSDEANSARFKYLVGKQAGVKPVEAQKLIVKAIPNSSLLEARVAVVSKEEGNQYVAAFLPALQSLCRTQAQVALVEHSIR